MFSPPKKKSETFSFFKDCFLREVSSQESKQCFIVESLQNFLFLNSTEVFRGGVCSTLFVFGMYVSFWQLYKGKILSIPSTFGT